MAPVITATVIYLSEANDTGFDRTLMILRLLVKRTTMTRSGGAQRPDKRRSGRRGSARRNERSAGFGVQARLAVGRDEFCCRAAKVARHHGTLQIELYSPALLQQGTRAFR